MAWHFSCLKHNHEKRQSDFDDAFNLVMIQRSNAAIVLESGWGALPQMSFERLKNHFRD